MEISKDILDRVSAVRIIGRGDAGDTYCASTGREMIEACDDEGRFEVRFENGSVEYVHLGKGVVRFIEFREMVRAASG